MTKLETVFNALVKSGFKAKMKDGMVTIRGFRFTVKGETVLVHNHKGELVGYGFSVLTALSAITQ